MITIDRLSDDKCYCCQEDYSCAQAIATLEGEELAIVPVCYGCLYSDV